MLLSLFNVNYICACSGNWVAQFLRRMSSIHSFIFRWTSWVVRIQHTLYDKIKAIIKAVRDHMGCPRAVWWSKCWQCTNRLLSHRKCRLTSLPLCTWQPGLSILSSCPHKQPTYAYHGLVSRTVLVAAVWPQRCGGDLRAGMRISIQMLTLVSQSLPREWTLGGIGASVSHCFHRPNEPHEMRFCCGLGVGSLPASSELHV